MTQNRSETGIQLKFVLIIFFAIFPLFAANSSASEKGGHKIGDPFQKGSLHAGGGIGGGPGLRTLGSEESHDLVLGFFGLGKILTDTQARGSWYAGNVELRGELFGGLQYYPETDYFAGLTPFLRYNFTSGSRFVPFIEGGAGISWTDIEGPDLMGKFQFNLQGGVGLHLFLRWDAAMNLQVRFFHFSNGGLRDSNHGLNALHFLIGYSRFF